MPETKASAKLAPLLAQFPHHPADSVLQAPSLRQYLAHTVSQKALALVLVDLSTANFLYFSPEALQYMPDLPGNSTAPHWYMWHRTVYTSDLAPVLRAQTLILERLLQADGSRNLESAQRVYRVLGDGSNITWVMEHQQPLQLPEHPELNLLLLTFQSLAQIRPQLTVRAWINWRAADATDLTREELDLTEQENRLTQSLFTPRELEVLRLLQAGLNSRDIANRLELSPHTVNVHRKKLMTKADCRNIAELIARISSSPNFWEETNAS